MSIQASEYFQELSRLLLSVQVTDRTGQALSLDEGVEQAVSQLLAVREASGKAMLVGNGGSAAITSHMHNDLAKCAGIKAMVFHETALLTAYSNDDGYEAAFEKQIVQWTQPDDLLIAVSSSGQSLNILQSARAAEMRGAKIITLSGFNAVNPLRAMGVINFYVPNHAYGFVELVHGALAHLMTDAAAAIVAGTTVQKEEHEIQSEINRTGHRWGGIRRRRASA